jgi:hypothetical protein
MANLMIIRVRDEGEAVLIVTHDGTTLLGFVTQTTLGDFLGRPLSIGECLSFVERNIKSFETILASKSGREIYIDASIACVEIDATDLAGGLVSRQF